MVYIDEGALGSGWALEVRESGEGVNSLIGRLRALERIYLDEHRAVRDGEAFVSLSWQDNDTLLVGGRPMEFDMEGGYEAVMGQMRIQSALAVMMAYAALLIVPLLALCGCQVEDKKQIEPVGQVDVSVLIESADVYGVSVEYCVERKALGGQACSRDPARTKPFVQGDEITFRFLKRDFQEIDYAGKTFGLIFSVLTEGEGSVPIDVLWEWPVQAGGKYSFGLSGSREEGYMLSPEFECVQAPLHELEEGALI